MSKKNLPSLEEQQKFIDERNKKHRTSFELAEGLIGKIQDKADKERKPFSKVLQEIIDDTFIDPSEFQKRYKNVALYDYQMDKLTEFANSLIPEKEKGKRGPNKGQALNLLIREYFNQEKNNGVK